MTTPRAKKRGGEKAREERKVAEMKRAGDRELAVFDAKARHEEADELLHVERLGRMERARR